MKNAEVGIRNAKIGNRAGDKLIETEGRRWRVKGKARKEGSEIKIAPIPSPYTLNLM